MLQSKISFIKHHVYITKFDNMKMFSFFGDYILFWAEIDAQSSTYEISPNYYNLRVK